MKKTFFVAAVLVTLCVAAYAHVDEATVRAAFKDFQEKHARKYIDGETRESRYQIFRANYIRAMTLNEKAGVVAHGVTQFMDKSPEELKGYLTFKRSATREVTPANMPKPIRGLPLLPEGQVPDSFDWRKKGAVSPVRDQGQCGSCWAFSAVEQVESAMMIKYGNGSTSDAWLSTQQVVDCDKNGGDYGCNGGDTITAYAYMMKAKGLEAEKTYKYQARDGVCQYKPTAAVVSVTGWSWTIPSCEHSDCTKQDEAKLATTMAVKGPASICVAASNDWFSYTGPAPFAGSCKNGYYDLNHCIQLVGLQNNGGSAYWIARNSWGTGWGDKGYIYLPYGKNSCGVADEVTFVEVA